MHELRGHTQAVWAVLALSATDVLTGTEVAQSQQRHMLAPSFFVRRVLTVGLTTASADKTIKLWRDGKCIHTYEGHSDAVRALQAIEGVGFLSGSNDG